MFTLFVFLVLKLATSPDNFPTPVGNNNSAIQFGNCTADFFGKNIPISSLQNGVRVLNPKNVTTNSDGIFIFNGRRFFTKIFVICVTIPPYGYIWITYRKAGNFEKFFKKIWNHPDRHDFLNRLIRSWPK